MAGADNNFWLGYAKDRLLNNISVREKAADKLESFLSWLWGIYTSIFVLGSFFDIIAGSTLQMAILITPILVIIISKYYCINVILPGKVEFDPAIVTQIIDGHDSIVREKSKRLKIAQIMTFVSILCLVSSIFLYHYFDETKDLKLLLQKEKLNKQITDATIANQIQKNELDSLKLINAIMEIKIGNYKSQLLLKCIESNDDSCYKKLKELK